VQVLFDDPGGYVTTSVETPAGAASAAAPNKLKALFGSQQAILFIFMVVLVAFFTAMKSLFFSTSVATNVLNDWSPIVLIAIGQTFVVITGGIDLSVGSTIAISGVVGALQMRRMTGEGDGSAGILVVGLLVAMVVGAIIGLINALLINKARLVPFVATLATFGVSQGFAIVWTRGGPVGGGPVNTIKTGVARYGPFSMPMLVVVVVVVLSGVLLHMTRFGRYTFAIGSNPFAARAAGINLQRHITKVYVLSGVLAGLAGMFFYIRLGTGAPTTGIGRELDAIAAVVIGGVALSGGVGRIAGSALGALVLATVASGLIIIGVPANYRMVVVGVLIALAGAAQGFRKNFGKASS
jgi:ribose transport system permease protein